MKPTSTSMTRPLGGLRYIARADAKCGHKLNKTLMLPYEIIRDIENGTRLKDYLITNRAGLDPVERIIADEFGLHDYSVIALRLKIEERRPGCAGSFCQGRGPLF